MQKQAAIFTRSTEAWTIAILFSCLLLGACEDDIVNDFENDFEDDLAMDDGAVSDGKTADEEMEEGSIGETEDGEVFVTNMEEEEVLDSNGFPAAAVGLSANNIRAVTMNVRIPSDSGERSFSTRSNYMASLVMTRKPHVIGFQEIKDQNHLDLEQKILPYKDYWWYHVDRGDKEGLAIFVDTSRFIVESSFYRNVTNSQRDDSCSWRDDEDSKNRPIQAVRLKDRQTNRRWYVHNVHYPSHNSCERHGMANIVSDYIAGRVYQNSDVILLGDFNDGVESNGRHNGSYDRVLNNTGFIDTYDAVKSTTSSDIFITTNNWDKDKRHGRKIDHILSSVSTSDVSNSFVDYSMYTSGGTRVWCRVVTSSGYCSGTSHKANNLRLYSDHWSVVADLKP